MVSLELNFLRISEVLFLPLNTYASLWLSSNYISAFSYPQTDKSPYQYRGMFHALSTVLREEGCRALYKGWLPSVIGVVSCSSL